MEQPERFSLEWSEFEANLQNTFGDLRREEVLKKVQIGGCGVKILDINILWCKSRGDE